MLLQGHVMHCGPKIDNIRKEAAVKQVILSVTTPLWFDYHYLGHPVQ